MQSSTRHTYSGKFSRDSIFTDRRSLLLFCGFDFCGREHSCLLCTVQSSLFCRYDFCSWGDYLQKLRKLDPSKVPRYTTYYNWRCLHWFVEEIRMFDFYSWLTRKIICNHNCWWTNIYHIAKKFGGDRTKFGGLAVYLCKCQIKIHQYFILACIHVCMMIPSRTTKFKSGLKLPLQKNLILAEL